MSDNGNDKSLIVATTATATQLYGQEDDITALGQLVKQIAPWANNRNSPMSNSEIGLVCRKALGMGLDPLNPHEVQIWKDKRGNVNFQLAYTLLHQWAHQIHGGHTEPRYIRLTEEEMVNQGLKPSDVAIRCEFVMKTDISLIATMLQAGWDAIEARQALTVCGVGVASAQEFSGQYFAPAARSKTWKVEKRAYTDAIRLRFGTPSRADIETMRRGRGEDRITPADWQVCTDETSEGQAHLAAMNANARTKPADPRPPEQVLAENGTLLHGAQEEMEI